MKKYYIKLFADIKIYLFRHIAASVMSLLVVICSTLIPICLKNIIDHGITEKNINQLTYHSKLFCVLIIIQIVFTYISTIIFKHISKDYILSTKIKILQKIQKMNGEELNNTNYGKLKNLLEIDVENIAGVITNFVLDIVRDVLQSIAVFFIMIFLDYKITIVLMFIQLSMIIINRILSKKVKEQNEGYIKFIDKRSLFFQEYFSNVFYIIADNLGSFFIKRFSNIEQNTQRARIETFKVSLLNANIGTFISSISTIFIYGYGGYNVIKGNISFGTLYAFTLYSGRFVAPLLRLSEKVLDIALMKFSIERVYKLLLINLNSSNEKVPLKYVDILAEDRFDLTFNSISFSYETEKVLDNVSFSNQSNKILAILGDSGSGKSTIINLIIRMWEPDTGEILINGKNIKNYNIEKLRSEISVVSQQKEIFNFSILDNLTMGNNVEFEKVISVTKKIQIYDYIMSLPEKFNTILEIGGNNLSEGQKQRIAICRAILKKSKIIIFDEATSNIDSNTEKVIKNNIIELLGDRMLIIISHKKTLVELADNIIVLLDGHIAESGSRASLIESGRYYRQFWDESNLVS